MFITINYWKLPHKISAREMLYSLQCNVDLIVHKEIPRVRKGSKFLSNATYHKLSTFLEIRQFHPRTFVFMFYIYISKAR